MGKQTFGGLHFEDVKELMREGREKGYDVSYSLSADDYHYEVTWE